MKALKLKQWFELSGCEGTRYVQALNYLNSRFEVQLGDSLHWDLRARRFDWQSCMRGLPKHK